MKLTKRLISLVLALAMVCTIVPVGFAVRAEETEETIAPAETVAIPEEGTAETAVPDAVGTQIPVIGETLPVQPRVNSIYEDVIDVSDLPAVEPQQKPDAGVQATFVDGDTAVEQLKEAMKKRETTITLHVFHTSNNYNALLDAMLALAMVHDGDPKGGDYLLGHFFGIAEGSTVEPQRVSGGYNYTFNLNMVYSTTASQEKTLDETVRYVLSKLSLDGKSDYEKIHAVYAYMCKYIRYDYDHLSDPDYLLQFSAYAALVKCKAVCQGYATLFYRFMMELGIDCRMIIGIGGDAENYGPHAWNIVAIDGLYYNLDSTWDEGATEYNWLLRNTWNFPYHYRDYVYDSLEFHTVYPMAEEDYVPGVPGAMDPFITYGYCGDSAIWLFSRYGELAITGTGAMYDYSTDLDTIPDWTYLYGGYINAVYVDEGITQIGDYSFYKLKGITEAVLPDSLEEVGFYAFYECENLQSVTLGSKVVTINNGAFSKCSSLTGIELPATLKIIGAEAFSRCGALETAVLPDHLESLGRDAFAHCGSLTEMHVPDTVTYMGTGVFAHCTSLTAATLPSQITDIGTEMFYYCSSLKTVVIPDGVTAIGSKAFSYCSALTTADIPETVTTIENSAFYQCTELTGTVLPAGLTTLGTYAFYNCKAITDITIPSGITQIGRATFYGCSALETLSLPDGLTAIDREAFYYCSALKSLEIPASLTTLGNQAFGGCGITSIYIPATVTSIGTEVFWNCNNLTTAVLEEGLTSVPGSLFCYCRALSDVTLPSTIVRVEERAFQGCDALESIEIPDGVTYIGQYAFWISGLKSVHLPKALTTIASSAFDGCKLTQVRIPENVTTLKYQAFGSCDDLTTIIFEGDAPEFDFATFNNTTATAYYPDDNETWTADKLQNYGGNITWVCLTCEHQNETVITPPTCTEQGYTTNTCTLCGMVTVTDYVDALGHTPGEVQVENEIPATCTAKGSYDNVTVCSVCGEECARETVVVDELPHTPGEARKENVQEPTCTAAGSYDNVVCCTECGQELSRETVTVEMLPHSYDSVTTAPTCTEQGCTTHTCADCGHSYVDGYVDALGHGYTYAVTELPGKYRTGILTATCTVCGGTEEIVLPALNGEDYTCEILTEPTEESTGLARYTWNVTTYGEISFEIVLRKLNDVVLGDVDGNGEIDTTDAYFIVMYYNEKLDLEENQLLAADVDGSGEVDTTDAYYIVMFYNEKIDAFPAEQ